MIISAATAKYSDADEVLDVDEVASWLNVSRDAVYSLIAEKRLNCKRVGKRRIIRITARAVKEYLAEPDDS